MADEKNQDLNEIAHNTRPPDQYEVGEADRLEEAVSDNPLDQSLAGIAQITEQAAESPVVQGFDIAVSGLEQSIESLGHAPAHPVEAMADTTHGDVTYLFGYTINQPVYTVVFGVLAILTLIEVLLAEIIQVDWLKIPLLVGIGLGKAALVILFYMHLKDDSRVFAVALILPLLIVVLSIAFLLGVPTTGY
ncbi:MAG: cytochrome C oxidase subunit IV family protein [Anaerolineae bacterium]|nr:cytochrome C oxidase subunit IV family protein [Anaerolineae bacterium]